MWLECEAEILCLCTGVNCCYPNLSSRDLFAAELQMNSKTVMEVKLSLLYQRVYSLLKRDTV